MMYWLFIGWWLVPIKWIGRVILWFTVPPVGALQSGKREHRKGIKKLQRGRS